MEQSSHRTAALSPFFFLLRLVIAFLAFILIGGYDGAGGVLLPSYQSFYHLDKAVVSTIFFAGTCGYLTAAFFSGPITEMLGTKKALMVGLLSMLGSCFAVGFQLPFPLFVCMIFPLSFGIGLIDTGFNAIMAQMPNGSVYLNLLHAFYGFGAFIGPIIASTLLLNSFVWSNVFQVWAALGLIVLLGLLFGVRQGSLAEAKQEPQQIKTLLMTTLSLPIVWLSASFLFLYVGLEVGLGSWLYSFLLEQRQEIPLYAGWIVSGYWLGLTVGRLIMSACIRWLGEVKTLFLCMGGVIVGLLMAWLAPWNLVAALGFLLIGIALGPMFPTIIALMPRMTPSHISTTAIGFLASLGAVGAAFFPWLVGNLAQLFGLWVLIPIAAILTLLLTVLWLAIYGFLKRLPSSAVGDETEAPSVLYTE